MSPVTIRKLARGGVASMVIILILVLFLLLLLFQSLAIMIPHLLSLLLLLTIIIVNELGTRGRRAMISILFTFNNTVNQLYYYF